jgi:hypothetical protein
VTAPRETRARHALSADAGGTRHRTAGADRVLFPLCGQLNNKLGRMGLGYLVSLVLSLLAAPFFILPFTAVAALEPIASRWLSAHVRLQAPELASSAGCVHD